MTKVVFMGTPDFALETLKTLWANREEKNIEIGYVVSQPDRQRGRGKKLQPTVTKSFADEVGIKVLQPENLKNNNEFYNLLREYNPDIIIVVAYGKIIPKEILDLPKYGTINIHGSLLPRWRGAAPIQRAVMAGDVKTGISIMKLVEEMDAGPVVATAETFTKDKTSEELFVELSSLGAELLMREWHNIFISELFVKQDESKVTYAPMIEKSEAKIDFQIDALSIERIVRGLNSWPVAYCNFKDKVLKVWEAKALEDNDILIKIKDDNFKAGQLVYVDKKNFVVKCSKGYILLKEVQLPGKKAMKIEEFLKGNTLEIGTYLV